MAPVRRSIDRFADRLRRRQTDYERLLGKNLRRYFPDYRFAPQFVVGPFILDFYCASLKLAIEVDGKHHFTAEGRKNDRDRTMYLNKLGIRVYRVSNSEVSSKMMAVLQGVETVIKQRQDRIAAEQLKRS